MGILDALLGISSEVNIEKIEKELEMILTDGEEVERVYVLVRDSFVFTNKRLILLDKQGLTGKKVKYHSIPYRNITHFCIETAGRFDMDSELKIWISGSHEPMTMEFKGDKSIYNVQKALSYYILN